MIIIPDIHTKIGIVDKILKAHPNDTYVFLGDYFDDFGDSPLIAGKVARWLKKHLDDPWKVFLFGNHDIQYAYPQVTGLHCSGFGWEKCGVINQILTQEDWRKLRFNCKYGKILLTHAGLHPMYSIEELDDSKIFAQLDEGSLPRILMPGKTRGGWAKVGGITWLDWNKEHKDREDWEQIVGHTPHGEPMWSENSVDLDTHLNHYGMLEGPSVKDLQILNAK